MIHITVESDRRHFTHNDCGYTQGLVGDNYCGGCGVDMRDFWAAVTHTYEQKHRIIWPEGGFWTDYSHVWSGEMYARCETCDGMVKLEVNFGR